MCQAEYSMSKNDRASEDSGLFGARYGRYTGEVKKSQEEEEKKRGHK